MTMVAGDMSKRFAGPAIALLVVLLDQLTKWVVMKFVVAPGEVIDVTPFLKLVHVYNTGVSFGLFSNDSSIGPWLLSAVGLAVCVILAVWMLREHHVLNVIALAMTIGGAVGNIIDRVRFGAVFDYIYLHAGRWDWPAFNVADSAITVGVIALLLGTLIRPADRHKIPENSRVEEQ